MSAYTSSHQGRRALLRNRIQQGLPVPPAIDFLEVSADQRTLRVTFFEDIPADGSGNPSDFGLGNLQIDGGVRVQGIRVSQISASGSVLSVTVDQPGDFSRYTLRIVAEAGSASPPAGFDPLLSQVDFSFKVDCPAGFDCEEAPAPPDAPLPSPRIDYLAKDYASFRRLMLDRLSVLAPGQDERSPADMGSALVELVAYAADQLSYYQDAVATEAYLGTARQRTSLRRHARLLDYNLHDGCNARAWVIFEVEPAADGKILPGAGEDHPGTLLLAGANGPGGMLADMQLAAALDGGAQPFETMADVMLYSAHNQLHFYTWGETLDCLPAGATRAWLKDDPLQRLLLRAGDVLILEEILGPASGQAADASSEHRHAVRLTRVDPQASLDIGGDGHPLRTPAALRSDPLTGQALVEIEWSAADELPFELCLAAEIEGQPVADMALARGNVALADHGRSMPLAVLGESAEILVTPAFGDRLRPTLAAGPLTQQGRIHASDGQMAAFDPGAAASAAFIWQPGDALPAIYLEDSDAPGAHWLPQRDLLGSDRFARAFVVEVESSGEARLRFGDGIFGRQPPEFSRLAATYRVGSGSAGNVGRETILHAFTPLPGILALRNPLPAQGGQDPESMQAARLYAPQAFRRQERAVTAEDYAAIAGRHAQVQRAQASLRWTGSWHTVFVTIDRSGGRAVDADFKQEMLDFLEPFRLAGHDLEVNGPEFVALDLALSVCVKAGYFQADVRRALLERLGSRSLTGGQRGFFHPDNFTFGQPVYLSQVISAALGAAGVETAELLRFQRWGKAANQELQNGVISFGALEIARLDNDPNFPENGQLSLTLQGGL